MVLIDMNAVLIPALSGIMADGMDMKSEQIRQLEALLLEKSHRLDELEADLKERDLIDNEREEELRLLQEVIDHLTLLLVSACYLKSTFVKLMLLLIIDQELDQSLSNLLYALHGIMLAICTNLPRGWKFG